MNGFVYDYQETAPGPQVASQQALVEELTIQITDKDDYENDRIEFAINSSLFRTLIHQEEFSKIFFNRYYIL